MVDRCVKTDLAEMIEDSFGRGYALNVRMKGIVRDMENSVTIPSELSLIITLLKLSLFIIPTILIAVGLIKLKGL